MDVIKYSAKIKYIADKLLSETNVLQVLNDLGQTILGGSYEYDLMWEPDVDLTVMCDDPRSTALLALNTFIEQKFFQKYEFGDFATFNRPNRPKSYIVNLQLPYQGQPWEIEIWFLQTFPNNPIDTLIKKKLNDTNKQIILEMKKTRSELGINKHIISSSDIYQQVLQSGITKLEDLRQ